MITAYRFSAKIYSHDISGEGARINGGRWNNRGVPVLYTSLAVSLGLLELLIHSLSYDFIKKNQLTIIELPNKSIKTLQSTDLKKDWVSDDDYSKFIGDEFVKSKSHLALKVPSAIIQHEYNLVINPLHALFSEVKIKKVSLFDFDERLFKV